MCVDDGTKAFLRSVLSLSAVAVDVLWSATRYVVWTGQMVLEVLHDRDKVVESEMSRLWVNGGYDEWPVGVLEKFQKNCPSRADFLNAPCAFAHLALGFKQKHA